MILYVRFVIQIHQSHDERVMQFIFYKQTNFFEWHFTNKYIWNIYKLKRKKTHQNEKKHAIITISDVIILSVIFLG